VTLAAPDRDPLNPGCAEGPADAQLRFTRPRLDAVPRARGRWWPRIRLLAGALVLAVVIWRLGTGPFLAGVAAVTPPAVLAALAIGAVTTVCSAWRWRVVAARLGVGLPMGRAVAAYYGSQFLNSTLPGGVLGDVHRAVRHGRATGDPARGSRSVAWERLAGPAVHLTLTALLLALLPVPWAMPPRWPGAVLFGALVAIAGTGLLLRRTRWVALAIADIRATVLARTAWPQVLLASVVIALGHALLFVVAARITGVTASTVALVPVSMVVLAAMLLPVNVGGWGPREGAAAGLFAAAGWGAAQGVAAATAFGVLALIATLPGLVVLLTRPLGQVTRRFTGRFSRRYVGPLAGGEVRPVG
jgi:uncharacterized membrane protein YbhN (UPF0104 family)